MTSHHLAYPGHLARGARDTNPSGPVHRLQGWLALHGYDPGPVDGVLGPRTEKALADFQFRSIDAIYERLGRLDDLSWSALTAPLARAMDTLNVRAITRSAGHIGSSISVGAAVETVARQWLAQRVGGGPLRELQGNSGPVVEHCTRWLAERDRLLCDCAWPAQEHSAEGVGCENYTPNWRLPWCAGWVSTVLRQACESLGVDMPIAGSLSCDVLAMQAKEAGLLRLARADEFVSRPGGVLWADGVDAVRPGDIFLVRGSRPGDWVHCGVVLEVLPHGGNRLITAEGNTNGDGSRNGTLLLERSRPLSGLDFICWRGE